ncbi:MAG TPA: hypothetical protein VG944_22855 [Fimbriimonas sp.]|nr:hypothetical protein [Fimbriimonas sp.]
MTNLLSERAAEKQRAREKDRRRIQSGEVTPVQLRDENSFLNLSGSIQILHFGRAPLRTK